MKDNLDCILYFLLSFYCLAMLLFVIVAKQKCPTEKIGHKINIVQFVCYLGLIIQTLPWILVTDKFLVVLSLCKGLSHHQEGY